MFGSVILGIMLIRRCDNLYKKLGWKLKKGEKTAPCGVYPIVPRKNEKTIIWGAV